MKSTTTDNYASSRGIYFNTGRGVQLQPIDIGHKDYIGLVSADTAFWSLIKKSLAAEALAEPSFLREYRRKEKSFVEEMNTLRFGLKPSAVYFNPTDRCNLNCSYCYIPKELRKNGRQMPLKKLLKALEILKAYFMSALPGGQRPQIIFHGAEPMLNREAIFRAMDEFGEYFRFGIQTNGTLLDDEAIEFLTARGISIGLSLDGHTADVANRLRKTWDGEGAFEKVTEAIKRLKGYENYSVICTATKENMSSLTEIVEFLHRMEVPACMLNPVRCTLPGARKSKPADYELSRHYLDALDRTYKLYKKTGRKLVVVNFANILMSIIAPSGRRLMCDISPCGGGRCFFAISANGDLFPCSEFIGLEKFKGGNIFGSLPVRQAGASGGKDNISKALETEAFKLVTGRKVEGIEPCFQCAVRHFCGSPCPAEAHEMNGSMQRPGAFCELYEEQVRYALRLIADGKEDAYLWDNWSKEVSTIMKLTKL